MDNPDSIPWSNRKVSAAEVEQLRARIKELEKRVESLESALEASAYDSCPDDE